MIEETALVYDDKIGELILESHTLPRLHFDCFCKPTVKHPYTIV